jgi:hypothetical protein
VPFQDFDAARRERARANDPVRFRLGGEDFTLLPNPSIFDALELAAAPEPTESITGAVEAIIRFIDALMPDDRSRSRWKKLQRRRKDPPTAEDYVELGAWLAEQYTGRPTVPSGDSSPGRPENGTDSSTGRFRPATDSAT